MKIASYNVNSIRRRLPLVLDWLGQHRPDVLCLQETKVEDEMFPASAFRDAGYHAAFHGMKSYNGVATLSLVEPERVVNNGDARFLRADIAGLPIINTYVPQGYSVVSEKYASKLEYFAQLRRYFEVNLDPLKPAIWLGDLNVAPEPIDVYHPDRRGNDPDFHIAARTAYKETAAWGFIDLFRKLHPEAVQYTYWDYFRNAFERNFGWRIDHILATPPLAERCRTIEIDLAPRQAEGASDHTVIWAEFD